MKRFLFFESTEGGMEYFDVISEAGLRTLYGWLDGNCAYGDREMLKWMETAEVGTEYSHRLGVLVRMKDAPSA